jgi:DNA mismatch repair protein MutS
MTKTKKTTPMLEQYWKFKDLHPDKILLFRMGDFYETFFEDAKITSKVLGITLTARNKSEDDPVPLAGFPYHALDNYLNKLVAAGQKVAICEQVENPKEAKGIVKRDIVDIITPGSLVDSNLISKPDNNFLSTIHFGKKDIIGLASIDVSTGDFVFTELKKVNLKGEILRILPAEIIVKDEKTKVEVVELIPDYTPLITIYDSWQNETSEALNILKDHFHTKSLESLGANRKKVGASAAGIALAYLKELKNDDLVHINHLVYYSIENYMLLDDISRRNLELTKSIRYGNKHGSLISILDNTLTPMGTRLLNNWLTHPLLNEEEIYLRQKSVQQLKERIEVNNAIRDILSEIGDISRIISKVATLKVNPRELIALRNYLNYSPKIINYLQEFDSQLLTSLSTNIADYSEIIALIDNSIMDNPPQNIKDGNIINDNFNSELDDLRDLSRDGKAWIAKLEDSEREQTGINSLKIGYNRVFGYYLEVTKTHKDKIPEHYIRKQTLVNSERYISPQLKEYESKVLGAEERIKSLEYEIYSQIRSKIQEYIEVIQQFVEVISVLDVLCSFAFTAHKNRYVRPSFSTDGSMEISECRHPVIEQLLVDEQYIPNDVILDNENNKIAIITGPNMAGKSTYLRQIGLIAIMAQIGSFIPAKKAVLPIFDKVFTRVGASDNLAQGQSTFLVEMIETANILNSATASSLILLDEIGRGTSTFDGLSLAWSIVEYIHNHKGAKTLFATHYHELTELENVLDSVKNYNIVVKTWKQDLIFLRKIERGGADQSYGIQVAHLAGMPKTVLKRAKQILKNLEEHELSPQGLVGKIKKQLSTMDDQITIFDLLEDKSQENQDLLQEISEIDLNQLSPLQAWQKLKDIQDKIDNKD